MDDDQLERLFGSPDFGLDGVWSKQTKSILASNPGSKIELNKWWALTCQNWRCPSCARPKAQLFRVGGNGTIAAKLVAHHDHVLELDQTLFNSAELNIPARNEHSEAREFVKKLACNFLERFQPTIICEECNNLEPKLKQKFQIPYRITLSPSEIGLLRREESDSQVGQILQRKLLTWDQVRIKMLRLATESFDEEVHKNAISHVYRANFVEGSAKRKIEECLVTASEPKKLSEKDYLRFSTSRPSQPFERTEQLPSPTREQYENYSHPHKQRQKYWNKLADEWHCPLCARSKFECFRSSPKARKTFNGNFYPIAMCQVYPEVDQTSEIIVCQDCKEFPTVVVSYLRKCNSEPLLAEVGHLLLTQSVVRRGVDARPHQRHQYRLPDVLALLQEMAISSIKEVDF